jgi:hypothetical protein
MMTDRFAFLGYNKCMCRAATAVTTLSVLLLLLLPASLGYGRTIIQEASGQFALPQLEEPTPPEEDTTPPPTTPTTPTTAPATTTNYTNNIRDPSIFLLRGLIGSYLPPQGAIGGGGAITPAAAGDSGHIVTGRFRLFANETLVRRFVAEMNIAAIDGSSFNNITITEGAPHRFEVTQANGSTGAQGASSNIVGSIYLNGGTTPVIDNVPMTLTIRGQSLAIQGIDIDEARIADTGQRDAIGAIDGQSIYGTIPRV